MKGSLKYLQQLSLPLMEDQVELCKAVAAGSTTVVTSGAQLYPLPPRVSQATRDTVTTELSGKGY